MKGIIEIEEILVLSAPLAVIEVNRYHICQSEKFTVIKAEAEKDS